MRDETERLVKEALERKTVTIKQCRTRIDAKCGKCGASTRVSADQGKVRVLYRCKECGEQQKTLWPDRQNRRSLHRGEAARRL